MRTGTGMMGKSIINTPKQFYTEVSINLTTEEKDCSKEFWQQMGAKPFVEIRVFDSFMSRGESSYASREETLSFLKRAVAMLERE